MSGSTARKVQPFTISTKLSLPKCSPDFPGDDCPGVPMTALDNCVLHQNLNEHVSLYLAQASPESTGGRFDSNSPAEEVVANEDRVNRNSLSRSIKKITLSNWHRESSSSEERMLGGSSAHTSCERNCNNNNCRTGKAQFKVFLRKEVEVEEEKQDTRRSQAGDRHSSGDRIVPLHMIAGCATTAPWKESVKNLEAGGVVGLKSCIQNSTRLANISKWSPLIVQFNCYVVQAEKWVRTKLRDLKDGCSIQEWERGTQTLQRDMKDFENTMIKLNQMGEQLMVQPNPSAEMVSRQLQTLQEQWQLLKQMAANQSKAVGGLRNLQEFNQKAEQLEAWIRQKEEKPLIAALLQENADKIQLTRRILDLKQEEQQFQVLHEEMNSLAHKLEKQGKSESRSIVARRKHLNKMWLRLQGTLKEHHETLQLALEAAAFLQQADVLLGTIRTKWRSLCGVGKQREPEPTLDLDVRDIASQIMMLDVTVSQLTSLHPSLVARVSLKHQDVKENWAQLQQLLRSEKPPLVSSTRRSVESPSPEQAKTTATNHSRKGAGEKPGRSSGWGVRKDIVGSVTESGRDHEGSSGSPGREITPGDNKRRRKFLRQSNALKDMPRQEMHLQNFCQVPDGELQQLLHTGHRWSPQMEDAVEELEDLWAELKRRHQENGVALREIDTALRLVGELEEVECWLGTVTDLLSEPTAMNLDDLHEDIQKISSLENQVVARRIKLQTLQEEVQMDPSPEHTAAAMIQRKMERVKKKLSCVQEALQRRALDLQDSLVLTEFLQNVQLEELLNQRNHTQEVANQLGSKESLHRLITQSSPQLGSEDMSKPLEELQEAVEMLNNVVKEREWAMEVASEKENLDHCRQALKDREETRLTWIVSQVETMRGRTEALAQDITQAERSFATVKSELDLLELQGLLKRQQEIESDMSDLGGTVLELKRKDPQLEEHSLVDVCDKSRWVQETLEAWKELQKLVLDNAVRGQQAVCLQRFFRDYLAIISWTEDTRAQIFSESPSVHGLSETQWEELGSNIETKFREFEELAAAGWELVAKEHHLSETIKERLEELQSMLGWVMVRWQAQSSQKDPSSKNDGWKVQDATVTVHQNCPNKVVPEVGVLEKDEGIPLALLSPQDDSAVQHHGQENESSSTAVLSVLGVLPVNQERLEEAESSEPFETDVPKETLVLQSSETPVLIVPQPGPSSLGGTVNLILSLGKKGRREASGSQAETSQPRGEEVLHKVSTFLHVKEKDGGGGMAPRSSTMPRPAKQAPTRANSTPLSGTRWGTSAFHTLPKISSSLFIQNLKRRGNSKAEDAQLLTLQGIMGTESTDQQPVQEEKHATRSTWPPKCHRKALTLQGLCSPHTELMDYVKNPLAQAIDAECDSPRETSGWRMFLRQNRITNKPESPKESKNTYQRLSLGSVLSLEIPKDPTVLRNIKDTVKVAERKQASQTCGVTQGKTAGAKAPETVIALQKRVLEGQPAVCQKPIRPRGAAQRFPKSEGGTWFEEMRINPGYSRQKPSCVTACEEDRWSPKSQSSSSDDFLDFRQNRLSCISLLHEQIGWEWDKLAAALGATGSANEVQAKQSTDHKVRETSKVKLKPSPAKATNCVNAASSTIKVKGPVMNETPKEDSTRGELECSEESFVGTPSSLVHLGFKSPTKLSVFECEVSHQNDIPESSRLGTLVLAPGGNATKAQKLPDMAEVCHPAHELFEEEEEELQAIWSNVEKHKRSVGVHDEQGRKMDKVQSPESSDGKLVLTSTDNVLVAKFRLPTSSQHLQGSEGERWTSNGIIRKSSPSQCWASLPSCQEPSEGTEAAPVGSTQGTCPMNQQMLQEEGRVLSKVLPSKLELQMMEGTLERKHLLQAGGRKANCRSWNLFHTVLMRQTLCFYQDKKDTLKSSMVALPLNLSGAVCTLETKYTKKTNCFTLQLKDGAKYLLRAPTEPLMKEWIAKLQQNSGLPEVDYFQSASQTVQGTTSAISVIPGHGASHFLGLHQPLTSKSQEAMLLPGPGVRMQLPQDVQNGPPQAGNGRRPAAIYTTEHTPRQCSSTESPSSQDPYTCQEEDCGLVTNKRRSYSFTSATYQKIMPLSLSKEPLGIGSSYSVTLYIGEQAPATPRPRCHSFMAIPRETLGERSQGASPRQKSKSVFRKFFGKKD
ncbi:spectrin beta chain, non-erythrocytic 2-like isoform X2 [Tiliqua scincoides]|uniref:spectrin beta chain, non-erythrocytic 2-like isoform X2 n=1 Tax=Tiliqua scincoides TaxID=71010 RepID=UPI0034634A5E